MYTFAKVNQFSIFPIFIHVQLPHGGQLHQIPSFIIFTPLDPSIVQLSFHPFSNFPKFTCCLTFTIIHPFSTLLRYCSTFAKFIYFFQLSCTVEHSNSSMFLFKKKKLKTFYAGWHPRKLKLVGKVLSIRFETTFLPLIQLVIYGHIHTCPLIEIHSIL